MSGTIQWLERLVGRNTPFRSLVVFGTSTAALQGSRLVAELITMGVVGPALFGYWKLWQLLFTYAPVLQFGIPNGANRNIPFHRGRGNVMQLRLTLHTTFTAIFAALALSGMVAAGVGVWTVRTLEFPGAMWLPALLGVSVATWTVLTQLLAVLRSLDRFPAFAIVQFITAAVLLLSSPVILNLGLIGLLLVTAMASVIGTGAAMWCLRDHLGLGWNCLTVKDLVAMGFPILLVGLAYTLLTTADRLIIVLLAGPELVGHYSLAILSFGTLSLLPLTVSQYYYPRISFALGESNSPERAMALAEEQIRISVVATALIATIAGLGILWLVPIFLPDYIAGIFPALILLPGLLGLASIGGYANWLNAIRRQDTYLRIQLMSLGLSVILSTTLMLGGLGLVGIALGTSIAFLAYAFLLRRAAYYLLPRIEPPTEIP